MCLYLPGLAPEDAAHIKDGSSHFTLSDEENPSQEFLVDDGLVDSRSSQVDEARLAIAERTAAWLPMAHSSYLWMVQYHILPVAEIRDAQTARSIASLVNASHCQHQQHQYQLGSRARQQLRPRTLIGMPRLLLL